METVLVIDDDRSVRDTVGLMLENEGFHAVLACDGETGFQQALELRPRLILVDVVMPGLSGIEVCWQLRADGVRTPLIVLSAMAGEMDKVQLLEMGADDYVVKPFGARELLARIRTVLRRATDEPKIIRFGDVEIDLIRRVVSRRREEVKLTRAEYNLLTYYLQHPDRVLSREQIFKSVWGYDWSHSRGPWTRTWRGYVKS
jgi:DNA-binding response OmpR family regulator